MPSGLFLQKINLDYYYPPFLERVLQLKAACLARGVKYLTTCGFRSWGESHQLHLKYLQGGPRAAPAGLSAHNYGLGDDSALIVKESPKRVCRWDDGDFDILGIEAARLGLIWGGNFKDGPHVNWPGFTNGTELQPLLKVWRDHQNLLLVPRLRKVWDYVDEHGPKLPPLRLS